MNSNDIRVDELGRRVKESIKDTEEYLSKINILSQAPEIECIKDGDKKYFISFGIDKDSESYNRIIIKEYDNNNLISEKKMIESKLPIRLKCYKFISILRETMDKAVTIFLDEVDYV